MYSVPALLLLATLALTGCAPEVTILDGDGGGATPGFVASAAAGAPSGGAATCPMLTQGYACPDECAAFVKRGDVNSSNYCTFPCDRNTPTGCPPGDECVNGACMPGPCYVTYLCPPHLGCVDADYCAPVEDFGARHCRMHAAPATGCEDECDAQIEVGATVLCTTECVDYPCPTGFGCSTLLDQTICVPMCFVDADCPDGLRCGATGLCDVVL